MSLIRLNFLVLLLHCTLAVSGQWESMHGPFGSFINDIGKNENFVFAATTGGVYRSADTGLTWEHKPFFSNCQFPCIQFDVRDSIIVADAVEIRSDSTIRRMYKSIDEGETWYELPRVHVQDFFDIAIVGADIFAYDHLNIWITKNEGQTWKQSLINHKVIYPDAFSHEDERVFVGDSAYLYIYTGDDANWTKIKIPLAESVATINARDSVLLVRDYSRSKLFISEDFGKSWFISPGDQWGNFENYFAWIGDTLYATFHKSIYTSVDNGHTWEKHLAQGLDWAFNMIALDTVLLSGYQYAGMFRSTDFGRSFHYSSEGIDAAYVTNLFLHDDQLFSGGYLQGVFNYDLPSHQWRRDYYNEDDRITCYDMGAAHGHLYLAASGAVFTFDTLSKQWIEDDPFTTFTLHYTDFYETPHGLMVGGSKDNYTGTLHLINEFGNWPLYNVHIDGEVFEPFAFTTNDHVQFLSNADQLAKSTNGGINWELISNFLEPGFHIYKTRGIASELFAIQGDPFDVHLRLSISHDNGNSWQFADDGIPREGNNTGIADLIAIGDYLVGRTNGYRSGIYYCLKSELQWHPFNEGLPFLGITDLVSDGDYLYVAVNTKSVWKRDVKDLYLTKTEESHITNAFHIFPNPVADELYIQWPDDIANQGHLQIYNIEGSLILDKLNSNFNESIDTKNIPNGIYLLKMKTLNGSHTEKFIVQH